MSLLCSRRAFIGALTAAALSPERLFGQAPTHPAPRADYVAKVWTTDKLAGSPSLVTLFDGVRAIPQIIDGIHCHCGCATMPGYYSLLSCFEGDAMARACPICQGQARLAIRLHKEGKSLADIRTAVDAQFA